MAGILIYDSNNSGGSFWLKTEDYENLENEGWNVFWVQPRDNYFARSVPKDSELLIPVTRHQGGSYLGVVATGAAKRFDDPNKGIEEWERITGQDAGSMGCSCCGPPHSFEYHNEDGTKQYATAHIVESACRF